MHDVVNTLVGTAAGLATGILTGFFFERRSTKAARAHASSLEAQLRTLREGIYSAGLHTNDSHNSGHTVGRDAVTAVLTWIRNRQDASGRVDRSVLITHFLAEGFDVGEIDRAVADLSSGGQVIQADDWLELA